MVEICLLSEILFNHLAILYILFYNIPLYIWVYKSIVVNVVNPSAGLLYGYIRFTHLDVSFCLLEVL